MKKQIININNFRQRERNIFFRKENKNKLSLWSFYQIIFALWLIHAKLTKRDFSATKRDLEEALGQVELTGNLIDIGGGSGWMSKYWNCRGYYVVVDPIFRKEIKNNNAYKKNKLFYIQAEAENLPFKKDFFDSALLCATIDHIGNPDLALKEASRVLKKNGHLFVVHKVDSKDRKYHLGHISAMSEKKLEEMIGKYFKIEKKLKSPDKKVIYIWLKNKRI